MDKIVLELTADRESGNLHSEIDVNSTSRIRVASYMLVILKELAKIDECALSMAIETYLDEEEG